MVGRGDDARERRLARHARHRRGGAVDGVDARLDRGEVGRELATGRVVRVQVHREVELAPQPGHELDRRRRPQEARHVLDGEDVRAGVDELLGDLEIVVERVEPLARIEQVAGVADGALRDGARLDGRRDRRAHRLDVVQRVEDPEDVDARVDGLEDEGADGLVGVGLVAEQVAPAQQHLQADVRDQLAQPRDALPRVLGEEAQRDVERRPAPDLQREHVRPQPRDVGRDDLHVVRAHARREERLVRIAQGRVGELQRVARAQPASEALRPELGEALLGAGGRVALRQPGQLRARVRARRRAAERAVHGALRQQAQDARRAVAAGRDRGELRALVDERRVQVARAEVGVVEQLAEERLVRRHAADADLLDCSPRPRDRGLHVDAAAS